MSFFNSKFSQKEKMLAKLFYRECPAEKRAKNLLKLASATHVFVVDLLHVLAPQRQAFFNFLAAASAINRNRIIVIALLDRKGLVPALRNQDMIMAYDVVPFDILNGAELYKRLARMLAKYSHLFQDTALKALLAMLSIWVKYKFDSNTSPWRVMEGVIMRIF